MMAVLTFKMKASYPPYIKILINVNWDQLLCFEPFETKKCKIFYYFNLDNINAAPNITNPIPKKI